MKKIVAALSGCMALLPWFSPEIQGATGAENPEIRQVRSVRTQEQPVIDGDLTDPVWALAESQGEFVRRSQPGRGEPAGVTTSFRVLHDDQYLYLAIEARGEDPSRLLRSITRRDDNLDHDDSVCLYFDSFLDRRSAYFLQTNPLGTQRDLASTNHGDHADIGWDGVWDVAVGPLPDGWTSEWRIPFELFRFDWSRDMTWGFDVFRSSKQHRENTEWCYVESNHNETLDPRLYGELAGLSGVKRPLMIQAIGSVVGSVERENQALSGGAGWEKTEDADAGLDLIWGVTPRMTLNATVNPDFAQIEADPDQLNLTGTELFLEERRPFFREGSAIFRAGDMLHPFYSRRIVEIDQGLKLAGQLGGSEFAALVVHGEDGAGEQNFFSVFRSQTPITDELGIGAWLAWKRNPDPLEDHTNDHGEWYDRVENDQNLLAGLDAEYQPGNWRLGLHAYHTWYPEELRAWYTDRPTDDREVYHLRCKYNGQDWTFNTHLMDYGMGYHPELGYTEISWLGQRYLDQWLWKTWTFREGHPIHHVEGFLEWALAYDRADWSDRTKLAFQGELTVEHRRHLSCSVEGGWADDRTFEKFNDFTRDDQGEILNPTAAYFASTLGEGNTDREYLRVRLHWTDGGWQGLRCSWRFGQHYYSKIRQGSVGWNWKPCRSLASELSLDYLDRYEPTAAYRRDHPDWNGLEVWIFREKLTYSFHRDLHLRAILSGYLDSDRWSNDYDLSLLLSYTYLPGSNLYLVYEHGWLPYDSDADALLGLDELERSRETFYLKATYMLDL